MLGKVFQMSGLYKGQARQAEPENGFRRAMNVWQDRSGKWRPKGEQAAFFTPVNPGDAATIRRIGFVRRFQNGIFSCSLATYDAGSSSDPTNATNMFHFVDKDGNDESPVYNVEAALSPDFGDWSFGRNSYPNTVVGSKLFFKAGTLPLLKYDGVQVLRAGLPVPLVSCSQYNTAGVVRYVRAIYARIGFDGTMVASGMLQFPVNNNTVDIRVDGGGTDLVGQSQVSPGFRDSPVLSDSYLDDTSWIQRDTTPPWAMPNASTIQCAAEVVLGVARHNLQVGNWVMFRDSDDTGANQTEASMYAFQVTEISGANDELISFNSVGKKYMRNSVSWVEYTVTSVASAPFSVAGGMEYGTSIYLLVYSSTTAAGTYLLNATLPVVGVGNAHTYSFNKTLTTAQTLNFFGGQVTADLQGWYDIGTVKLQFPYAFDGYRPGILGLTKYQGQLISYDRKAIYFSDTTAGGSDEMISGFTNFVPLGSEYGDIVCVEGCEDFIFISRERKNYVLVGDISTGNFTISECDTETAGAFGSTAATAIKGGVAYVSRQGAFFCNASGQISEFSSGISRLFGSSREFVTDPDGVSFRPYLMVDEVAPTTGGGFDGWDGNIVRMKYDADRNLLAILYGRRVDEAVSADDKYAILAINLKTGAMFEWKTDSGGANDVIVTDFEFLETYDPATGKFIGSLVQAGLTMTKEDITEARVSRRFLLSSWLTGGEPSLEKQVKQVKFYGQMTSCRIFHQENWEGFTDIDDIVSPRTNVVWPTTNNQNDNDFEHKQRLNTSRCQAVSIGFEPLDDNFSIEGYEVEWDLIQESVKK